MKQPPQAVVGLPISFSEITDRVPSEDEIDALVSEFEKEPTVLMLAMLNTFLSFYEHEPSEFSYIQGFLFSNLLDDDLFERVKERFPHEQRDSRPLFHRQQLLTLIKKTLLLARNDRGYNPNDAKTKEGKYELGRVALMTTNLFDSSEQGARLTMQSEAEEEKRRMRDEFCTQMLPIFELSNPPDVLSALVRNREYFRIFQDTLPNGKFCFSSGDGIAERFFKLTGLKLNDYLLLIFALYANYENAARQDGAIKRLIDDPGNFNIGINVLFSQMRFTNEERLAFFKLTAIDVDGLIEACRTSCSRLSLKQEYDFTAFRTYPLVYTRAEKDIATCLDSSFLAEKISTGVYHTIKMPLEEAARGTEPHADESARRAAAKAHVEFLGHWGGAFEIYVNDRLSETHSPGLKGFYRCPYYDEPPSGSDTEVFDAVLDYGEDLIVFEHKGKYLDLGAKYSGNRELFLADLKSNKRLGKGMYQIADNLGFVFNNRPGETRLFFHERDDAGLPTKRFGLKDIKHIKRIYPVIVHQDFSLRLKCVNLIMNECFQQEIKRRNVDEAMVRPLTLLTVEDLETLMPYLSDVRLPDILKAYSKLDDPLMTFTKFLHWFLRQRSMKVHQNEWILAKSDEVWNELNAMFVQPLGEAK